MSTQCRSIVGLGATGIAVDIECHLSNNLPTIVIVGFASRTVNEAKDRLRGAFMNSHIPLPRRRITLNLAPADLPKSDSGLDLAMAASILAADGAIPPVASDQVCIGELGLDGRVRPVRGIIGKLVAGRSLGIRQFFIPTANLAQAQLVPHITMYAVPDLRSLYNHLTGRQLLPEIRTGAGVTPALVTTTRRPDEPHLSDISGQSSAKRALTIAAAGGHNIMFVGPPGTGKSMLARALPSLLPPLSHEELLEVTQLHSLASNEYEQLQLERPVRSPHHSLSQRAMLGGGSELKPGEVSLSHRGVLLLDELPEFDRTTLEALRQPLEDRVIHVSRVKDSVAYPAHFMLVATANPCPCGYRGTDRDCQCAGSAIARYKTKLSGPIRDRIDLCCSVSDVAYEKLLQPPPPGADQQAAELVLQTRQRQAARYGSPVCLNCDLAGRDLRRLSRLSAAAKTTLQQAAERMGLSARAYTRIVRVARTIADMEQCVDITPAHISEALSYRAEPAG